MNDLPLLRTARSDDAARMLRVIRTAFAARRPVDPPAEALGDTVTDIERSLELGRGVVAELAGELIGCLLVEFEGDLATIRRVSVLPEHAGGGIATELVTEAAYVAAGHGARAVELLTRREFPELLAWWQHHGFHIARETDTGFILSSQLPVLLEVPTADAMRELGGRLAALLRAGDVVIATGDLGAGKTTLAQGLGTALQVEGPVISPTFVISRVHPSSVGGPAFVHVDAYRLQDPAELADIDLDATLADAVTMVEWGQGKAEWLSSERLEVSIERGNGSDRRTVLLQGVGSRWAGALDPLRSSK